jgi:hypothetical protein
VPTPGQQQGQTQRKQQGQTQADKYFNQNNTLYNTPKTARIVGAGLGAAGKHPAKVVTKSGLCGAWALHCAVLHTPSRSELGTVAPPSTCGIHAISLGGIQQEQVFYGSVD